MRERGFLGYFRFEFGRERFVDGYYFFNFEIYNTHIEYIHRRKYINTYILVCRKRRKYTRNTYHLGFKHSSVNFVRTGNKKILIRNIYIKKEIFFKYL